MVNKLVLVFLGGGVGTVLRYIVNYSFSLMQIPQISTFLVNILGSFIFGIILAFATAWGFAGINVLNRRLHNVHFTVILMLNSLICFLFCLSWVGIEGLIYGFHFYSLKQYVYLFLMAFIDYGALTCAMIAYQADSPSFISLLSYATVIYSFAADYFIFSSVISGV